MPARMEKLWTLLVFLELDLSDSMFFFSSQFKILIPFTLLKNVN